MVAVLDVLSSTPKSYQLSLSEMSNVQRAQKPRPLSQSETLISYETWKDNLVYLLSLEADFAPFLLTTATWTKAGTTNRGFTDDTSLPPTNANGKTAAQKVVILERMLGQIANFCPVITRSTIIKKSTKLADIWSEIREYYGFQSSGSQILDLSNFKLEPSESPQNLYQRLLSFFEDNLLTAGNNIQHEGATVTVDEEMTPTLQNTIVWFWLSLVHPELPALVKQKYGAELRARTLKSLKSEISMAVPALLAELRSVEEARAMRSSVYFAPKPARRDKSDRRSTNGKSCTLCKAAGRPHTTHYMSTCKYLPDADKKAIARARMVPAGDDKSSDSSGESDTDEEPLVAGARRVDIEASPYLDVFHDHLAVRLVYDCGATTQMTRASAAQMLNVPIVPASQIAKQSDGFSQLNVIGEIHTEFVRDGYVFKWDSLVVTTLDVDFLAGTPFMSQNKTYANLHDKLIIYGSGSKKVKVPYGPAARKTDFKVRRTQAYVCKAQKATRAMPGQFVEVELPDDTSQDGVWALEPRFDARNKSLPDMWPPPQEIRSVARTIRIMNTSDEIISVKRNEHFCQVRRIESPKPKQTKYEPYLPPIPSSSSSEMHSASVSVDPDDLMPSEIKREFVRLNEQFDSVFDPSISRYNGHSGNVEGVINMGPTLPPQRKGRLPSYSHEKKVELQDRFDMLERHGVFAKPEDVGVVVEYLNMSFFVNDPGKPSKAPRLVTSFGEVGQYSKPQPSLMPDVDSTLRMIGRWKYIIKSDLSKAFYQIPLAKDSMKFCGVVTPFKGVRVYTRCAMGMPGSETALEEVTNRVLGHIIAEGHAAKVADDLFCGADTLQDLLGIWFRVLQALHDNNLSIAAHKTIICPRSTLLLGWIWAQGTLQVSPHRVSALASTPHPETVRALRSYIGAYKVLSRVLKGTATLLHPLELLVAGKNSRDRVLWDDEARDAFCQARDMLSSSKVITIPRPSDELWIVTDAAQKSGGLAATLFLLRDKSLQLGGFFNAHMKVYQKRWLPCEVEALAIHSAIKHFAPYIIQSDTPTKVLTDSKACVQAYQKLIRGQFSASVRVTTYLASLSRYQIHVGHISAEANLPSDYASRNTVVCDSESCQVCAFVSEAEEAAVMTLSVRDVIEGRATMPFTNRVAWRATQVEDLNLRRVHAHLQQGTRPTKKNTLVGDVKRYLQQVVIASDNLLIVRDNQPFQRQRERIVVPRAVLDGLLTALHIRFDHPSEHQLKLIFSRHFYALNTQDVITTVTQACHHCSSLKSIPSHFHEQSSVTPPIHVGVRFAMDVMRRYKQYVLVLRETVTSFTWTVLIPSEKHTDLRDGILILAAEMRPCSDECLSIRVDPAPGFCALVDDSALKRSRVCIDIGDRKNVNKNPVAENAIKELGNEILRASPQVQVISPVLLATATANMNMRIRYTGLSARELWTQRDQFTNEPLPLDDSEVIALQAHLRESSHGPSAKAKASKFPHADPVISVGDLVYLKSERDKIKPRDKYLVVARPSIDVCKLRKFTKSQFRTRPYEVKTCDIYHVKPNRMCADADPVAHLSGDSKPNHMSASADPVAHLNGDIKPNHMSASADPVAHLNGGIGVPVSSSIPLPVDLQVPDTQSRANMHPPSFITSAPDDLIRPELDTSLYNTVEHSLEISPPVSLPVPEIPPPISPPMAVGLPPDTPPAEPPPAVPPGRRSKRSTAGQMPARYKDFVLSRDDNDG